MSFGPVGKVLEEVVLPAAIAGIRALWDRARAGDASAREQLLAVMGDGDRLRIERALDEAMLATLPTESER